MLHGTSHSEYNLPSTGPRTPRGWRTPCTSYTEHTSQAATSTHVRCLLLVHFTCHIPLEFCLHLPHHVCLTYECISHEGHVFHTVYTSHTVSASHPFHIMCYVPLRLHASLTHVYTPHAAYTSPTEPTSHPMSAPHLCLTLTAPILCQVHPHFGPRVTICLHLCVWLTPLHSE